MSSIPTTHMSSLARFAVRIDHVAIAVRNLEESLAFYHGVLGFEVAEQRTTIGRETGMISAVLQGGQITVVLIQGTSPDSQVSRYVENYGPGVQHIAIEVRDLLEVRDELAKAGLEFNTGVINGTGIRQSFTARDPGSGMMYEFIERQTNDGHFSDESVLELFRQLEVKGAY